MALKGVYFNPKSDVLFTKMNSLPSLIKLVRLRDILPLNAVIRDIISFDCKDIYYNLTKMGGSNNFNEIDLLTVCELAKGVDEVLKSWMNVSILSNSGAPGSVKIEHVVFNYNHNSLDKNSLFYNTQINNRIDLTPVHKYLGIFTPSKINVAFTMKEFFNKSVYVGG